MTDPIAVTALPAGPGTIRPSDDATRAAFAALLMAGTPAVHRPTPAAAIPAAAVQPVTGLANLPATRTPSASMPDRAPSRALHAQASRAYRDADDTDRG